MPRVNTKYILARLLLDNPGIEEMDLMEKVKSVLHHYVKQGWMIDFNLRDAGERPRRIVEILRQAYFVGAILDPYLNPTHFHVKSRVWLDQIIEHYEEENPKVKTDYPIGETE